MPRGSKWLAMQWAGQDGIQTYKDSNTTLFKPRKVASFAEYREHPRPPSWRETCRPIVHVHAILCNEARPASRHGLVAVVRTHGTSRPGCAMSDVPQPAVLCGIPLPRKS